MGNEKIRLLHFNKTLSALEGVRQKEKAPFAGHIKKVLIHWPDGCDALVDVAVHHSTIQFCPREDYLALNDATATFDFNEEVKAEEDIWVEMKNGDSANSHTITITVSVHGEE